MTYAQNAVAAVKKIRKTNLQFLWAPLGLRHYSKKVFAGEPLRAIAEAGFATEKT